ncbi:hypothetical protein ACFU99_28565 [Streptomyces sp. NPDC057654]|uniref:hypothetical protein n=1 Tax=Streptomyces sp. NPDC057654 TaxID=3346196 RepID=UPI003695339F
MSELHYTAWLVNDPSCLDQGCMDVTILQDQLIGGDPGDDADWASDTSKPTALYAVTTVDAQEGDIADGIEEAEALMRQAGWQVTSKWASLPNAFTATVERERD